MRVSRTRVDRASVRSTLHQTPFVALLCCLSQVRHHALRLYSGERKAKKKIRCFRITSVITFMAFGNQKIPSFSKSFTTTLTTLLIVFFAELGLKLSLMPVQTSSPSGVVVA